MCFLKPKISDEEPIAIYFIKDKEKSIEIRTDAEIKKFQSMIIEKDILRSKKLVNNLIRIIVLGISESGKTTITQSLRFKHIILTIEERQRKFLQVQLLVCQSMMSIVKAMNCYNIKFNSNETEIAAYNFLANFQCNTLYEGAALHDFWDIVDILWKDEILKTIAQSKIFVKLEENAFFFLDRVKIMKKKDYILETDCILRLRTVTTDIEETKFTNKEGISFNITDVGGQRNHRKKWIQCFSDVTIIIYVVDLSAFNEFLIEDPQINRMTEALLVFKDIWFNRYLRNVSVILFLNKYDKFADKIDNQGCHIEDNFPNYKLYKILDAVHHSYQVPNESEKVLRGKMFILQMFIDISEEMLKSSTGHFNSKFLMPYFTCAVEYDNMKKVYNMCEIVMRKEAMKKLYQIL